MARAWLPRLGGPAAGGGVGPVALTPGSGAGAQLRAAPRTVAWQQGSRWRAGCPGPLAAPLAPTPARLRGRGLCVWAEASLRITLLCICPVLSGSGPWAVTAAGVGCSQQVPHSARPWVLSASGSPLSWRPTWRDESLCLVTQGWVEATSTHPLLLQSPQAESHFHISKYLTKNQKNNSLWHMKITWSSKSSTPKSCSGEQSPPSTEGWSGLFLAVVAGLRGCHSGRGAKPEMLVT